MILWQNDWVNLAGNSQFAVQESRHGVAVVDHARKSSTKGMTTRSVDVEALPPIQTRFLPVKLEISSLETRPLVGELQNRGQRHGDGDGANSIEKTICTGNRTGRECWLSPSGDANWTANNPKQGILL
jgi:hypothetical protein